MSTSGLKEALAAGATLPASWYADPDVLRRERERIFARAWQYAGRSEHVAEPGSYLASRAGHIPVVVVRDAEGALNAFVNVCRHRGHEVVSGAGRRETLQCPYHAWTYGLDGCLRSAPRSDREPGFEPENLSLVSVQADVWGPFVFVNPDLDAPPLAEALGSLPARLLAALELDALVFRERQEWEVKANWKVALENYLECYHCPVAHPSFSKIIDVDPDAYGLSSEGLVMSQVGPVRASALDGNGRNLPYVPEGEVSQAQYHLVWPNFTINVDPGRLNLSVNAWIPTALDRTAGFSDYFFGPDVPEDVIADMMAFDQQVGDEDNALVESVQRGLESGMVPQGRLLPESEQLIAHFQRLVFDALAG